tara:strand:+ start:182 stop:604 length:423 start_codon:yes stop_codon:yes gene_type:complete
MQGFVYLIRNKDIYKIGITKNIARRMKQLKPHSIIQIIQVRDFMNIEKELHEYFKSKRIPQTEYFRLSNGDIRDCINLMKNVESIDKKTQKRFISKKKSLVFSILFSLLFITIAKTNDFNASLFLFQLSGISLIGFLMID